MANANQQVRLDNPTVITGNPAPTKAAVQDVRLDVPAVGVQKNPVDGSTWISRESLIPK